MLAIPLPQADPLPLVDDGMGGLRFQDSRVALDIVIEKFDDGMSPEAIARAYDTVSLADIYAVLAYYLRHRDEVAEYMARREAFAAEVQKKIQALPKSNDGHIGRLRVQR